MHYCYFNGIIQATEDARLQINDLGLLRGYGLFDYFLCYNNRPFQWDWYWERFENSARILGLENPISKETAHQTVLGLAKRSGLQTCAIRFLLTGGYSSDAMTVHSPNLLIMSEDVSLLKASDYENGIRVISCEYLRDMPEVKSTDYKRLMSLQTQIKTANASDVLFYKNGEASEFSRSNLFIFKGNTLITPHQNILKGITRRTVLTLAEKHFAIEQRSVQLQEIWEADEVFMTSSTKRILPIASIDGKTVGKSQEKSYFLLNLLNGMIDGW